MHFLIEEKKLDKAEKIQVFISYFLQLIILSTVILSAIKKNWLTLFLGTGIFLLTLLPSILRKRLKVSLPAEFEFITVLFIFISLYLGELHSYYTIFWWWDIILHTSSGFLFGILGFLFIYILNEERKVNVKLIPSFVALFAFAFSITIGALWEIYEFGMDNIFGFFMQKGSLGDTMWDLIVNAIGALIISVMGYFYVKGGSSAILDRMIRKFLKRNRKLFKRQK